MFPNKLTKMIYTTDPLAAIRELDNKLDSCMASFESRMAVSSGTSLEQLATEVKQFKVCMKLAIDLVRSQMSQVASLVDEAENRSRRKFLLFRGIQETDSENLKDVITNIMVDTFKILDSTPESIHFSYRLGKDSTQGGVRPVLVKFRSLDVRSCIWRNKKELKGTAVSVAEYLTATRRNFFNEGRKLYGVHKCWSQDGNVYLLTSDGKKHRVVSHVQLMEIAAKFPPTPSGTSAASSSAKKSAQASASSGVAAPAQPTSTASSAPSARSAKTGRFVRAK